MSLVLLTPLHVFSLLYTRYKNIKKSAILSYSLLALIPIALLTLWFIFSPRNANEIDINPYEILGVPKDATISQIKQSYRQLSRKYHPDRLKHDAKNSNNDEIKTLFKKINLAKEILTNSTLRKNYDEFGNPNGKEWWDDEYPDWIVRPNGKVLFATYSLLGLLLIFIPVCMVYLIPSLKEPPRFVRDHFFEKLDQIEQNFLEKGEDEAAIHNFEQLKKEWEDINLKFKYWNNSPWHIILTFAIRSRIALCQVTLGKFEEVNEFANEFKTKHRLAMKMRSEQSRMYIENEYGEAVKATPSGPNVSEFLSPYCEDICNEIDIILKQQGEKKAAKWKPIRKTIKSLV